MTTLTTLLHRSARRRAIRELMKLDDRLLNDIGFTRSDLSMMLSGRNETGRGSL